jgi:F0F1-type ATP synthase assembly protein I
VSGPVRVDSGVYDPATQPKRPDATLGELFAEMTSELSTLFRKEVELAKVEGKEELKRAGVAGGALGGAAAAGFLALMFVSFAVAWLLDEVMHTALAFLIVGVLWGIAAAVLLSMARNKAKDIEPLPETTRTLKEDAQWLRTQTS